VTSTVSLGDTELTRIGLGTNRLTDTPENRSFLETAVGETELNFIDSAHLYAGGESERTIGAALSANADGVVVATKGGYNAGGGVDGLRSELEESFERLQTDVIDLYYQHRVHPDLEVEDAVGLMNEYREAGRITHIGISEVSVDQIERARSVAVTMTTEGGRELIDELSVKYNDRPYPPEPPEHVRVVCRLSPTKVLGR
jgi:aryl-alcohol dehydrogenase-like predicted oxidoreductase